MRRGKKFFAVILSLGLLFSTLFYGNSFVTKADTQSIRACWISFLDMEIYLCDLNESEFTGKVNDMYDRIISNNMNTVIVHVRAMGDAMYPSKYYPWSVYLSSDRSDPGYDPLAIMVELAHDKGLRFEAWVNPYRLSKDAETTEEFLATEYDEKYNDLILTYENAEGEICLSLDPSNQKAIELIRDGVVEIVANYDVDAIHFDDYFYMDYMADDLEIIERQRYVNAMVAQIYEAIKNENPDCEFGISPAGNLDNARKQGADIDTWLSVPGYLDYIMPQIYWSDNFITEEGTVAMFTDRCEEWLELNQLNIRMYVGLALYRVREDSYNDLGWSSASDNLATQWKKACEMGFDGFALFRYQWLELEISTEELKNLQQYLEDNPLGGHLAIRDTAKYILNIGARNLINREE